MGVDVVARAMAKASGVRAPFYVSGEYPPLFEGTTTSTNVSGIANEMWLSPYMPYRDMVFSKLAAHLNVVSAGQFGRLVVYNTGVAGAPGATASKRATTLLGATLDISTAAQGNLENTFIGGGTITMLANTLYFVGVHCGDVTQGWNAISNSNIFSQIFKPHKALADIMNSNASGDVGIGFRYAGNVFANGSPADLTNVTPNSEGRSFGGNNLPAIWGRIA